MNKEIIDLLAEFDEMGYAPTTLCENPGQEAKTWKAELICELKRLDAIIQDNADSAATLIAEQKKFAKEQRQLAVKEFAQKLKARLEKFIWKHNIPECIFNDVIADLLKEYEQ